MQTQFVYLAGPILDCDRAEANDWREQFNQRLTRHFGSSKVIRGVSPLRCEPLIGERYNLEYPDPRFGSPDAISSKNFMDVQRCHITLAYFPKEITERKVSLGTVCELAWAKALAKPTILVSTAPVIRRHPVVQACAGWKLDTLDEAFEVITGTLAVYA